MRYNDKGDSVKDLIIRILDYIDYNLYAKITMEELSRVFYFNKDYIMRVFKKELGITIIDYITKRKIYNSLKQLETTKDLVLKVPISHGYSSQEYYTESFQKVLGVNPLTYRKFTKPNTSISYEDISIIRKNLTELKYQLDQIEQYRKSVPRETKKVLSLYK